MDFLALFFIGIRKDRERMRSRGGAKTLTAAEKPRRSEEKEIIMTITMSIMMIEVKIDDCWVLYEVGALLFFYTSHRRKGGIGGHEDDVRSNTPRKV